MLRTQLEEVRKIEEVISDQLKEKGSDCEKLEIELVSLRSKLEEKDK